jgi:predicted aldo/keto reductase-like oxidoreductase
MQYREIGKTGYKAGIIGLGCEYLDKKPYEQVKETIDTALESNINLLDVFMPGKEVRENMPKRLVWACDTANISSVNTNAIISRQRKGKRITCSRNTIE